MDDDLVANVAVARCLCGERLELRPSPSDVIGAGTRLGKYVLERRIATGGMGEIFYGKIPGVEGFEREVAIKKMLPHLSADRAFVDMMIREAKLTVLLNHPNIVQVYDLAKEGDEYYIAMEYVPGATIGSIMERCRHAESQLPVEVVVHVALNVLRGLSYAHTLCDPGGKPMHILHRDITPQNILVTRDAWVKITDFGIAKARNEISTTSPGLIKGKLGYIAPEQLSGRDADHRADLFCVGILLWEGLALCRLFKGSDEVDTFRMIVEARVPSLRAIRDDVSAEIEGVVRKALARDPDDRHQSAAEFANALVAAISPAIADDYAIAARTYLREHGEFFARVETSADGGQLASAATVVTTDPLHQPTEPDVISVTDLAWRAPRQARSWTIWLAAGAAALVSAGVYFGLRAYDGAGVSRVSSPPASAPPAVVASPAPSSPPPVSPAPSPNPEPSAAPEEKKPPPIKSARPAVRSLTAQEIEAAVRSRRARLQACIRDNFDVANPGGTMMLTLKIVQDGTIESVEVDPPRWAGTPLANCIQRTIKQIKLRRHPDAFVEIRFPLDVEVQQSAPSE